MIRFLVLATTVLGFSSVESFAPIQKMPNLARSFQRYQILLLHLASQQQDPPASSDADSPATPSPAAKRGPPSSSLSKSEPSPIDDLKSKIVRVTDNADLILGNILSGEFGKRGEAYVATQVFLVLCILFGDLPVLSDFLNFLCGPVLMAVGAGAVALGIVDMGASLSPWPVPTGDDLITTGIYSKVRHPIYAGLLALMGGFSVATASAPRLLLTGALWYALDLKSDFEEKELIKEYAEYKDYQERCRESSFPKKLLQSCPGQTKTTVDLVTFSKAQEHESD